MTDPIAQAGAVVIGQSAGRSPACDPIAQAGLPHWTPEDGIIGLTEAARDLLGLWHKDSATVGYRKDRWDCLSAALEDPATASLTTAKATCEAAGYGVVKRRTWEVWRGQGAFDCRSETMLTTLNLIAPDPDPLREALIASGLSGPQLELSLAAVKGVG